MVRYREVDSNPRRARGCCRKLPWLSVSHASGTWFRANRASDFSRGRGRCTTSPIFSERTGAARSWGPKGLGLAPNPWYPPGGFQDLNAGVNRSWRQHMVTHMSRHAGNIRCSLHMKRSWQMTHRNRRSRSGSVRPHT
eukprot:2402309-Amphidinium_carterae.2